MRRTDKGRGLKIQETISKKDPGLNLLPLITFRSTKRSSPKCRLGGSIKMLPRPKSAAGLQGTKRTLIRKGRSPHTKDGRWCLDKWTSSNLQLKSPCLLLLQSTKSWKTSSLLSMRGKMEPTRTTIKYFKSFSSNNRQLTRARGTVTWGRSKA